VPGGGTFEKLFDLELGDCGGIEKEPFGAIPDE